MSSSTSDASATIAHELEPQPAPSAQRTLTIEDRAQEWTEEAGYLRNITATVTEDVADVQSCHSRPT